jgi:hypothetical protein
MKITALKMRFASLAILLALCGPAAAQWQVPDHAAPIGRGAGIGFRSAGPCAAGQFLAYMAGPSADPSCVTKDFVSVKDYGAVGNSNGTHGNGQDDSAAFAAALNNAPSGNVHVPCGTYRLGSSVVVTGVGSKYRLHGEGWCSKIFLDSATATDGAFAFQPASFCVECVVVHGLNFLNPNVSGQSGILLNNELFAVISNNIFQGSNTKFGAFLTTSYGPRFIGNTFLDAGGTLLGTAGDASLNNAVIWRNRVAGSGAGFSSYGLELNCGDAFNLSVLGNDIELNFGGVKFTNCRSVDFSDNYVENSTNQNLLFAGANNSFTIRNNLFGLSASNSISNITKMVFGANSLFSSAFTFTATALGVIIEPTNFDGGGGTIGAPPTPTLSACGTGSPQIFGTRLAGLLIEGTTTTGCTITFELAFDSAPFCVVTHGNGVVTGFTMSTITTSGFSITHASASSALFSYQCQPTH